MRVSGTGKLIGVVLASASAARGTSPAMVRAAVALTRRLGAASSGFSAAGRYCQTLRIGRRLLA